MVAVEGDSIGLELAVASEMSEEDSLDIVEMEGCLEARYAL